MKLTGEFTNVAGATIMAAPYAITTMISAGIMHPASTLAAVAIGAGLFGLRNTITSLFSNVKKIEEIETTDAMRDIAAKIGLGKTPNVYIAEISELNAYAYSDAVLFTQLAINNLSEEEFLATYAHECAHIKRRDHLIYQSGLMSSFAGAFGSLISMGNLIISAGNADDMKINSFISLAYVSSMFFGPVIKKAYNSQSVRHKMEFDCDRREVLATGNLAAAISCLQNLSKGDDPDCDSKSHPSINKRIENMKSAYADSQNDRCGEPTPRVINLAPI